MLARLEKQYAWPVLLLLLAVFGAGPNWGLSPEAKATALGRLVEESRSGSRSTEEESGDAEGSDVSEMVLARRSRGAKLRLALGGPTLFRLSLRHVPHGMQAWLEQPDVAASERERQWGLGAPLRI